MTWPREPPSVSVASGTWPRPAAARASAMPCAVWIAVPLGASTLFGWCSSTTSADSKYGAATRAKWSASTAEIAKFGAMNTLWSGLPASVSAAETWLSLSSVQPVVPTTTLTPCLTSVSTLPSATDGTVNSTTTSVFCGLIAVRSSPASSASASCMSAAPSTAATTCDPMRPLAPTTETRIMMHQLSGCGCFLRLVPPSSVAAGVSSSGRRTRSTRFPADSGTKMRNAKPGKELWNPKKRRKHYP